MAGVSTKDIKNRIRSMESTKQITKAMEMVAASKLRQAQNRITASRPYFEILSNTISDIVATNRDFTSPYLRKREGNRALFVVIAGDRGLAGGYNSNVIKLAVSRMEGKEATVLPIGKKAVDYFRSKGYALLAETYAEAADVDIGDCFSIAKLLSKVWLAGNFDEIHVAYTNFVSVLSQTADVRQLLPLIPEEREATASRCVTLYEPEPEEVQRVLPLRPWLLAITAFAASKILPVER
jgi:F-type H+-transporting ATPase subunit gamma